ncbi:MAG TPA: hypothetical protein VEU09_12410, partial [Candidatus Binatia bacterium]|nr:hypothetical protein [Candidatus Binatia bacterium]
MNKGELAKMKDRRVRLRPVPKQLAQDGRDVGELDSTWCIGQASEKGLLLIRRDGPQWFFLP